MVVTAIVVGALSSMAALHIRPSTTPLPITRFAFTLGEDQQLTNAARQVIAISPDGTKMAYTANSRLYLTFDVGARGAAYPGDRSLPKLQRVEPCFSPDGESIAFWSGDDQTIKRIAVTGGVAVTICQATNPFGMAWGTDGIVFTQAEGIMRVSRQQRPTGTARRRQR